MPEFYSYMCIPSRKIFFLFYIILFITTIEGFSQPREINFRYLTRENGLSRSSITALYQDSKGYIWFGTDDGLNRYDGYNFKVYKHRFKSATGLSNNFINDIIEDKDHRIWIATNYGLNVYDRNEDKFSSYFNTPGINTSLSSNFIVSLYLDKKGNLWIGTGLGLNKYDKATNTFKRFNYVSHTKTGLNSNIVNCIAEDNRNNLWLGTDAGIKKFNLNKEKFIPFDAKDKSLASLDDYRINVISKDPSNAMWIGTNGKGLFQFDSKNNTLKKEELSDNVIMSIICDHQKNIWVGTENGGVRLKPLGQKGFLHYNNDPRNLFSLSGKTAMCILEDTQGNIWIGTHLGGVNIYSPKVPNFKKYVTGAWAGALSYKDINGFIEETNGEIWVGSDGGGINIFDPVTDKFRQYRYKSNDPKSLGADAVLTLRKDNNNETWIGTWGGGLNRFNKETKDFTRFLHDPTDKNSVSSNYVYAIHQDKKNQYWVGTFYGGLNQFDPNTKNFKPIKFAPDKKTRFTGRDVLVINEDANGSIWFSTIDSGLNQLTADRKKFLHHFNTSQDDLRDAVRAIFTDSKKRLWIGKTGLYLFNNKTNSFSLYSTNPYLVNEQIVSILEDKKGNLWLGTTNGIIQFNPETKYTKRYTTADGLQGLEFCQNAALLTKRGQMYFGGINGFNTFYPDSIKSYHYTYPTYITDLSIFNKSINSGNNGNTIAKYINENRTVTLKHNQSVISIEYTALNYVSPKKTNYAYKLDGFDKDWNYVGTQRKATYTNLDPGDYTFYVKASSPNGNWNTKPASVKLTITPPFYLTWWFKLLTLVVITLIIFWILQNKRKSELRALHEENKEKMYQMQLQFFTNISHEFRTPLTLIIGALEQAFKLNQDSVFIRHYNTIHRNANRLLHLISELMDFRKVESGVLKLKVMPGNFSSFLSEIVHDFKEQAQSHDISFSVSLDKEYNDTWFDRQVMEKILLNLINNAFKYTQDGGSVSVKVFSSLNDYSTIYSNSVIIENEYKSKNYIYVSIIDNGIGISKDSIEHLFERFYRVSDSHLGSGIGLAFVKSLTFLHKGNIYVDSERHKGTQIVIAIPCNKEDYTQEELWPENLNENAVQIESMQFKELPYKSPSNGKAEVQSNKETDSAQKQCILIVEDNEELRAYFKEILEESYHIIEARNGQEGLLKAKEASPSLIISDVMMPIMDGIDLCKHIKEDFETSHIPFILLTAKDALESRIQGIESGADHYFSKPVSTELLILTLKNLFKQKQKIKERYLKDYQVEVRDLVHTSKDKEFMDKLLHLIEEKLEEPELNIDFVCREMGVSASKLYKKIKDITGQSSSEFIRTIRLKKAVEIMTHEDVLITEVMYRVGILSKSYFTTIFKKEYGMTPSQFQQQLEQQRPSKNA